MKVVEINGAKTFLKALSLDNKELSGSGREYIFRGQADAKWEAIPSAFRPSRRLFRDGVLEPLGVRTFREQIEAEFQTLSSFVYELNKNGFHIPREEILNMDTNTRGYVKFVTEIGRGEAIWPPKVFHSAIAIAQHYEVPTRFLDFSYDPYVALYFATKGVLEGINSDYLSVYAVNIFDYSLRSYDFLQGSETDDLYKTSKNNRICQIVKAPSSYNHNLRNQKGLFLAFIEKCFYANDTFEGFSLEKYIENKTRRPKVIKFVTKSCNAPEIRRLLQNRFYTASSMFPSIEGCVKGMYEQNGLS